MTSRRPSDVNFPVFRARFEPDWIDYNGHLRDAYYGLVASSTSTV